MGRPGSPARGEYYEASHSPEMIERERHFERMKKELKR
jgi:chromosome segregation ATPase